MVHRMEDIEFSKPVHIQRLEQALKLEPFLNYVEHIINQPISDIDTASESETGGTISIKNGIARTKEERENDKSHLYNFDGVRRKRLWLKEVLVSSSESDTDDDDDDDDDDNGADLTQDYLENMLREHRLRKHDQSHFYQNEENRGYLYYSAGLLSRVDKFPEHQRFMAGSRRKKNKEKREKEKLKKKLKKEDDGDDYDVDSPLAQNEDSMHSFPDDASDDLTIPIKGRSRGSKKDKKPKKLDAQALAMRRHKLWVLMAKKEVGRCQKSKASFRKEVLQNCKRIATGCMRVCRQKALQSQKTVKDKVWMLKRLTRTMQGEWKKFDRILKEQNRRAEREAEEQRKMDKEILEVKRQQRKVNFLITLPELYAHFMKNKMDSASPDDEDTNNILKQLEDDGPMPSSTVDDYDCEAMKAQALKTAHEAYSNQQARISQFTGEDDGIPGLGGTREAKEHPQPRVFKGVLKSYQMKGMNWLANLYYFGINGILADEMGLGKTVQSIAFLAHICEQYDTWGPFLIITPASTLHNWTGEIARFVPCFQVVPYWGNPEERKNLRKFFDGKNLGSRDASFHIVVTSYQIVIQDFKFLNRLKWNYMVLDEAQAIKSINSQRWKLLLGFSCRNRLLLSGTPIQNSMAELWALLHFIMPSLFDSHLWFNEWFSKDIEGHVENKTHVDEIHLNRLHMILKPFMLRRVKTEVENELTDKIEIMMYCPLTLRQKFLYTGLKNKISIDELLRSSMGPSSQQSSVTSTLMNLVMQFRKVCNHPELLERREVRSPFIMHPQPYVIPKLVFREAFLLDAIPSKHHLLFNKFSVFHPHHIHSSLVSEENESGRCFSFLRFIDVSPREMSETVLNGLKARCLLLMAALQYAHIRFLRNRWIEKNKNEVSASKRIPSRRDLLIVDSDLCPPNIASSSVLSDLIFTSCTSTVYTFKDHVLHHIPETMNHRIIRSKKEKLLMEELAESQKINSDGEDQQENLIKVEPKEEVCSPVAPETKPSPAKISLSQKTGHIPKLGSLHKGGSSHKSSHKKTSTGSKHSPKKINIIKKEPIIGCVDDLPKEIDLNLLPEIPHVERPPVTRTCLPTLLPSFLMHTCAKKEPMQEPIIGLQKEPMQEPIIGCVDDLPKESDLYLLPEIPHVERPSVTRTCLPTLLPSFLMHTCAKAQCLGKELYCHDRSCAWWHVRSLEADTPEDLTCILHGSTQLENEWMERRQKFTGVEVGGLRGSYPRLGWSRILIPDKHSLIMDAGKLYVLDTLLSRLKAESHRVLIYSQMTKMIDLLEEYMWHRKHKYMRLDGSSKISDRRDMVADFQTKADIFVFLLSTRAGGVGINLTAADTVIFYDSDWNPTVDQQAMDRAHRLGQTKQVTVYRLVCKATIEERILQRAREKSEIQRMVISGGNFKPDTLKPKEVVSLLLDDDIEKQYRARQQERRILEEHKIEVNREKMRERMRKRYAEKKWEREQEEKRRRVEEGIVDIGGCGDTTPLNSTPPSPTHSEVSVTTSLHLDDGSNDGSLIVDVESPAPPTPVSLCGSVGGVGSSSMSTSSGAPVRGQRKRGRPKGSSLRGRLSRSSEAGAAAASSVAASSSSTTVPINASDESPGGGGGNDVSPNGNGGGGSGGSGGAGGGGGGGGGRDGGHPMKRGRGRPRLLPLGPGHQGTRTPPALPLALDTTLNTPKPDDNSQKPFGFYT